MSTLPHAQTHAIHPRRRRTSTRTKPKPVVAPSQALLALLASITPNAASPVPTPVDFLCPSLILCPTPLPTPPTIPRLRKRGPYHFAGVDASTNPSSADLPVKYEQGDDGNWYPASAWSLHGKSKHQLPEQSSSSSASSSAPTRTRTPTGLDIADDIADVSTTTTQPTSTSALPDITDSLPTGWQPTPDRTRFYSIPLIVTFSLVLAVGITLCLAVTVLWHKNRSSVRDIEKAKLRKGRRENDDDEEEDDDDDRLEEALRVMQEVERRAVKKDKMWTRWRREARMGLRRRRPMVGTRPPEARPDPDNESRPSSSRRASIVSSRSGQAPDRPIPSASDPPATLPPIVPSPPSSPPPPPSAPRTPPLPPAYRRSSRRRGGSARRPIVLPPDSDEEERSSDEASAEHEEEDPSFDGPVSAHVATDDKAVLERMRRQASAPRIGEGAGEASAQAPEWEDERLEDFADDADAGPSSPPSPPTPRLRLPPPPLPLPLPDPALPYYAPRFDVPGPSSPPYELDEAAAAVVPSAPPEEEEEGDMVMVPSAPPLDEEGEEHERARPDDRSDHVPQAPSAPPSRGASRSRSRSRSSSLSPVLLPRYEP